MAHGDGKEDSADKEPDGKMNLRSENPRRLADDLPREGFRGNIAFDVPLAPLTYYRIGGPAAVLIEPTTSDELLIASRLLKESRLEVFILGAGSNVLVSDDGFPGAVIRLAGDFEKLGSSEKDITIHAGASVSLVRVLKEAVKIGMKGAERLAGIPGWIGGAIFMNAGTHGEYIDGLLESVDMIYESGEPQTIHPDNCGFAYRMSRFQKTGEIIRGCTLIGDRINPKTLEAEIDRRLERRRNTQPVDVPSCGCVFRNPEGDKSAGMLIEEAGLKGTRSGDAVISERHANFVVNEGNASARDVLSLMALAQRKIYESTGIKLLPEVRGVGFEKPLEVILDEW